MLHEPFAGDAFDDGGAPLVVAARAHPARDLRVAVRPLATLLATEPRTFGEPPDGQVTDAIDGAVGVVALQVIVTTPRTLTVRPISTSFSLLHLNLH